MTPIRLAVAVSDPLTDRAPLVSDLGALGFGIPGDFGVGPRRAAGIGSTR